MHKNQKGPLIVEYMGFTGTQKDLAVMLNISHSAMRKRYERYKKEVARIAAGIEKIKKPGRPKKEKPQKEVKVRSCVVCGNQFTGIRRKYCSSDCSELAKHASARKYVKHKPITQRDCSVCGKAYQAAGSSRHKTCSKECSEKGSAITRAAWHASNRRRLSVEEKAARRKARKEASAAIRAEKKAMALSLALTERECIRCGVTFKHKKKDKNTCSDKCYDAVHRKTYKKKKRESRMPVMREISCKQCGKDFKSIHPGAVYCSKQCLKKADRTRNRVSDHHKARKAISGRLRDVLRKKGINKTISVMKYVGCSTLEFFEHLSSQLNGAMTWESYGVFGWHIDHIVPCAAFDLTIEEHRYLCFDKENLRPLWHDENIAKSHALSECDIESLDSKYLERLVNSGILEKCNDKWRVVRHADLQ